MEESNQSYMEKLTLKMTEPYGTVRYYSDLFMDIIADVNPDDQSTGDIIIEAFKLAIKDWRQYYEEGAKEIRRIEQKANDEIKTNEKG